MNPHSFLPNREARPLTLDAPEGMCAEQLFLGEGGMAFEVAVLTADRRPTATELRGIHKTRTGGRAAPVAVVVLWGNGRAAMCAPAGDDLAIATDADRAQVERICDTALGAADRHAARRFLGAALAQLEAPVPGLRNEGLFALNELTAGVPQRVDWIEAGTKGRPALSARGRQLVERLGFTIQPTPGPWSVLVAGETKMAVAIFLERPDEIEPASGRFDSVSPVSYALAKADQENLDYVVVTAGSAVRIYPVKPGVGTGRRGRTETYVELNLDLLREAHAPYLWLLCSAEALIGEGSFDQILRHSADYAAALGTRLRERVYQEVVPQLAKALVTARTLNEPSAEQLRETYEMALLVLFRLLFVAYAEDKELLPLHTNREYRVHSLKKIARRLADAVERRARFEAEDFYWNEVTQLWKAVDKGNRGWGVPSYNGGLFSSEREISTPGHALTGITLPDRDFAPALAALLVDRTAEGVAGPVDFRSLGVREFGTIYEGLLESELSVADSDLAVDHRTDAYLPAKGKAEVLVRAGEVYLHNRSGARKATGAYYTKDFAVEHLLDRALEPALDDHLARLDATYDKRERAGKFFDFHVADIAMGSGHFLVSAIDRIERRLSNYLAKTPLPAVMDELERLRKTALEALGPEWAGDPIEDTQLLRRQIARRCVFGVDLNPLAVELARLSIWIHTFVPGLPLSLLDQNLVVGNSLVGIATMDEAYDVLREGGATPELGEDLFASAAAERLAKAREPIERLARLADATAAEIKEARALYQKARRAIRPEEVLLTVITASRLDEEVAEAVREGRVATRLESQGDVFSDALVRKAEDVLRDLDVLHFPIVFPQVFLGETPSFDVIVGNPPWEKPRVEERAFWARHFPGLRSLPQREQENSQARLRRQRPDLVTTYERELAEAEALRAALTAGPYPGMGTGDPDLYKAFCWRFWNLISRDGGRIGVVLPRSALAAKGSTEFRREVFSRAERVDVTTLLNSRGWVFDEAEYRYTIGLVALGRRESEQTAVALRGPYPTLERYRSGVVREPAVFYGTEIQTWNDTSSLPLLPSDESVEVFARLRGSPRLDLDDGVSWRARPYAELHATNDKHLMDIKSKDCPKGYWPVYKGESFDLWMPDTGTYYAWADPKQMLPHLQEKRVRGARNSRSPFSEFDEAWLKDTKTLPSLRPRIAFRDVTRSTDTRTVRATLVPAEVFIVHLAPYLVFPRGDIRDEVFLLGVLSSLPLDWFARRFVETHLTYFVLNPLPVPRPPTDHPLRRRAVELAGRSACPDKRFAAWAKELGVACGPLQEDEKDDMIHELDAVMAQLYGLTEKHLVHIFETFHEGWDYEERLRATLAHFRRLGQHASG